MRTTWQAATVCVASRRCERTIHDLHPAPASGVDADDADAGSLDADATGAGTATTAGDAAGTAGTAGAHAFAETVAIAIET
jgi:hypothetical protein